MLELTWVEVLLATFAMGLGALAQGSVGFGSALIAAPLLALIDPGLVPVPVIVAASSLTLMVALRERRDVNLRAVVWALAGRLPGTGLGVLALRVLSASQLGVCFGALVMCAVAMVGLGRAPARTPSNLFGAGLVAGVMGTVTSVGGPPIALMFHDARGPELRGTLSGYFMLSTVMSLGGLWLGGLFGLRELAYAGLLMPGVMMGFALSHYTRSYLDAGRTRPAILTLSGVASLGVIIKYL